MKLENKTKQAALEVLGRRNLLRWIVVGTLTFCSMATWAVPIPFDSKPISLTAREQPVADFLQDFFGPQDIPVAVSPQIKGAVNGYFNGAPDAVYRKIARSFNLVEYFDGAVLHIYAPSEIATRTFSVPADVAESALRAIQEMRLPDGRNTARASRSGSIVASGTRRFIEQVDEVIRAQAMNRRIKSPFGVVKVFYLRYAWAQDVSISAGGRPVTVPGVASLVRGVMLGNTRSRVTVVEKESATRATATRSRAPSNRSSSVLGGSTGDAEMSSTAVLQAAAGMRGNPQATAPGREAGGPGLANSGTLQGGSSSIAEDPYATVTQAGDARVEADARLNAVIVRDTPERLAEYERLIASLDIEPQAVEIEATIVDVNTDKVRELGINWRVTGSHASGLYGRGDSSDLLLGLGSVTPAAITPQGRGGFLSAVLGNSVQFVARMNALQEKGAAKVVSSPQIITLSNVEALFDSSQTFYVRVAGRDEVDLFNVSAGTVLRVTPHVFKDRGEVRIKLLVAIDDGSLSARAVDGLPVVNRSSIDTQALIYEGESLLIGGITRQSTLDETSQVPLLGDVPLVGNLFRNSKAGTSRIERMFLISPRLVARRSPKVGADGSPAAVVPEKFDSQIKSIPPAPSDGVEDARPSISPSVDLDLYHGN